MVKKTKLKLLKALTRAPFLFYSNNSTGYFVVYVGMYRDR